MRYGRFSWALAALLAATVTATGCGDSGEGTTGASGSESDSDASATSGATDPTSETTAGPGTTTNATGSTSDPSAGTTTPLTTTETTDSPTTAMGCAPGEEDCGDGCVNIDADPENCGGCGIDCAGAGMICVLGSCEVMCDDAETLCGDVCVDTQTDPENCGGCAVACADGQVCNAGACALGCDMGLTACDDSCVDLQTDPNFCGACDIACVGDELCVDGTCTLECAPNEQICNNACVDPMVDVANCGDCDNACPEPQNGVAECVDGGCGVVCDDGYLANADNTNCTSCDAAAILLDGPIAYWRLGEGPGSSTAVDELGNNDGTYVDTMLGVAGVSGDGDTAASLGGSNLSRVNVPTLDAMPNDAISVELWVNSSEAGDGTPFSYAVNAQNNEVLLFNVNSLSFYVKGQNTAGVADVADGAWHHVVATWQSSDGDTNIYVDGAPVHNQVLVPGQTITPGGHLALGHEQDSVNGGYDPNQRLIGELDEVAVYDFVLTPQQVAQHYEAVQGNMCE